MKAYCSDKRLLVMNSGTLVQDAGRALENNHVGAVVVQDLGEVVGIVTDRDIALRVIGFELDPAETELRDVMTSEVATLTIDATEDEAADLMLARHVRRIPIVDGSRAIGIVTLDDLILSGMIELSVLAEIVRAQLSEPAPAKPARKIYPTRPSSSRRSETREERRQSRQGKTMREFSTRLREDLGMEDSERALIAFEVVCSGLVQRLTPGEAHDFVSQLPSILRERLLDLPPGPNFGVTRATIEEEMAMRLDLDSEAASQLVSRVATSLGDFVSAQEVEQVIGQLPRSMKAIFTPPP